MLFPYEANWYEDWNDYSVVTIDKERGNWLLFYNLNQTNAGGCQQKVSQVDEVLWAWSASADPTPLSLYPKVLKVNKDSEYIVAVTDGRTGSPVSGAEVSDTSGIFSIFTDSSGAATLNFPILGDFTYKATYDGSIRSNALNVTVVEPNGRCPPTGSA
ncbi:MAG: hypothetical protein Q9214_003089, partial [Letrouitia sp. 1 TL-2023]